MQCRSCSPGGGDGGGDERVTSVGGCGYLNEGKDEGEGEGECEGEGEGEG